MSEIVCKRIYDQWKETDGFRILVDRFWPRGMKKETAGIDLWAKNIAPSDDLRRWFGHDPVPDRTVCQPGCIRVLRYSENKTLDGKCNASLCGEGQQA